MAVTGCDEILAAVVFTVETGELRDDDVTCMFDKGTGITEQRRVFCFSHFVTKRIVLSATGLPSSPNTLLSTDNRELRLTSPTLSSALEYGTLVLGPLLDVEVDTTMLSEVRILPVIFLFCFLLSGGMMIGLPGMILCFFGLGCFCF